MSGRDGGTRREEMPVYAIRILSRLAAEGHAVLRGGTPVHARLRDRLVALGLTTIGVDLICSVLAFVFERHQPRSQIDTFGGAVFWASAQLLTVSSNLSDPVSAPARVLDILMEIYAITVTGSLAGVFGAFLIRRGEESDGVGSSGRPPGG